MPGRDQAGNRRAFALAVAQREDPRTLRWIGWIVIGFALLNTVVPPRTPLFELVGVVVIAGAMIASSYFLQRASAPAGLVPWVFSSLVAALVCWILVMYAHGHEAANLTYVIIGTTAFGPMTLAWRPFIVNGLVMLSATTWVVIGSSDLPAADWMVGVCASLVVGGVLLHLRLRLLGDLSDAEQEIEHLSTLDRLTGLLNRHGLEARVPLLWSDAVRRGESIGIYFVDVCALKKANDEHGHEFGDLVIKDVADAIAASVREGDLAARWGGDEFVMVVRGRGIPGEEMNNRLQSHIADHSSVSDAGWTTTATVGHASTLAATSSFDQLLRQADLHMYAQRGLNH